jgi:hypothetical protein
VAKRPTDAGAPPAAEIITVAEVEGSCRHREQAPLRTWEDEAEPAAHPRRNGAPQFHLQPSTSKMRSLARRERRQRLRRSQPRLPARAPDGGGGEPQAADCGRPVSGSQIASSRFRVLSSEGTIACHLCNIPQKHSLESSGIDVFMLRVHGASIISNCDGGGHPRSSRSRWFAKLRSCAGRQGRKNAEQGPGGISGDMGDLLSVCG